MKQKSSLGSRFRDVIILTAALLLLQNTVLSPGTGSCASAAEQKGGAARKTAVQQADTKAGQEKELFSKEYTDEDFRPAPQGESFGSLLAKTLFVIGLLIGGFFLFYRFVTKKIGFPAVGTRAVTMISTVPLGTNKYLQIVDVAGKMLVLGVTESSVNLVTEITSKEEKDRINLLSSSEPEKILPFGEFLDKHLSGLSDFFPGKTKTGNAKKDSAVDTSFLQQQKARLKKLRGDTDE